MYNVVEEGIKASITTKQRLLNSKETHEKIIEIAESCVNSMLSGGKVILAGNGGSFADSQHVAAEFVARFKHDRSPYPAIALGCNASSVTAIANDYDYRFIFSRELQAIGDSKDTFIAISTSGNSNNIIEAIHAAKAMSIPTFGMSGHGRSCSSMSGICNVLAVESDDTARIQECHILIGHIICEIVELAMAKVR